jgi:hypothetical protein
VTRYTICVDGQYFAEETMERIEGHAIAPLGFFQMVGDNYMTAYRFAPERGQAWEGDLFSATGYLRGIYERTRYLPDDKKPRRIALESVTPSTST